MSADFITVVRDIRDNLYPDIVIKHDAIVVMRDQAQVSATASATSASNALTSEQNASVSEQNASASESSATASEVASANSANLASLSELKAYKWAEETEDTEVETGEYSAKHWAIKAQIASVSVANVLGSDTVANILAKPTPTAGDAWIATDTGTDSESTAVAIGDIVRYNGTNWINIGAIQGEQGIQGIQGIQGTQGADGEVSLIKGRGTYAYITGLASPSSGDIYIVDDTTVNATRGDGLRYDGASWLNVGQIQGDAGDLASDGSTQMDTGYTPSNDQDIATKKYVDDSMPVGFVGMYSGLLADIPSSWAICDGTNGTPNLVDKFVLGTATELAIGGTGGYADSIIPEHTHNADHNHTGSSASSGTHSHTGARDISTVAVERNAGNPVTISNPLYTTNTGNAGDHVHTITVNTKTMNVGYTGEEAAGKNIPPYVKLAYIMKIA